MWFEKSGACKRGRRWTFLLSGEFTNQLETKKRFSFLTCLCDQLAVVSDVQLVVMIHFQCPHQHCSRPLWCLDAWVMTRLSSAAAVTCGRWLLFYQVTVLIAVRSKICKSRCGGKLRWALFSFQPRRQSFHYQLPGSKSILISCCSAQVYQATCMRAFRALGHIRPTAEARRFPPPSPPRPLPSPPRSAMACCKRLLNDNQTERRPLLGH